MGRSGIHAPYYTPSGERVNRDLLKRMLLNIVDNSIKFTPKGGRVELTLAGEDDRAVLEVSDTGPGIPGDDLLFTFRILD